MTGRQAGYVYVMRNPATTEGLCKIGFTRGPRGTRLPWNGAGQRSRRRRALQALTLSRRLRGGAAWGDVMGLVNLGTLNRAPQFTCVTRTPSGIGDTSICSTHSSTAHSVFS